MAVDDEDVNIRVRTTGTAETNRETGKVARGLDDIGDEAQTAARKVRELNRATTSARVNLGPFSTNLRGGAIAVGYLVMGLEKVGPVAFGAAEAIASLAGGGAAGGGVGLLALAQGAGVARLAVGGLTDALGGNEEAARSLSPEMYELFRALSDSRDMLTETATEGFGPGLERGTMGALRNADVLNRIVRDTSQELGRLAADGGMMLGSDEWGGDIATMGATNVRIIGNLGDATLNLANAAKDVLVEAGPLTEWMSEGIEEGSRLAMVWARDARAGGDLRRFFQGAREDIRLLMSATGNSGQGIINIFGANDVDGTRTLASLDQITQRFEDWTNSPAVRQNFGEAIRKEVADGVAAAAGAAAETLPGAAGRAAEVFWDSFWAASPEGKALIAALTGAKLAGSIRGMTPLTPMYVQQVGGVGGITPTGPVDKTPKWAKAAKTAGKFALPLLPALAIAEADILPHGRNLPTRGAGNDEREESRPSRDNRGAFERLMDPSEPTVGRGNSHPLNPGSAFDPIIELRSTINIDGETAARKTERAKARRRARSR